MPHSQWLYYDESSEIPETVWRREIAGYWIEPASKPFSAALVSAIAKRDSDPRLGAMQWLP